MIKVCPIIQKYTIIREESLTLVEEVNMVGCIHSMQGMYLPTFGASGKEMEKRPLTTGLFVLFAPKIGI
jgi:hypothetical protein